MKNKIIPIALIILISLVFIGAKSALALNVPSHTDYVVDLASVLSASQKRTLSLSLKNFHKTKGPQIQLLIVPSLEDEALENYTMKVVDQWKLGDAKKDNGVLLFIALKEKKLRIEVGQGLEGDLPDITAGRIIQKEILPFFKQGDFVQGIINGLGSIAKHVGGNLKNIPQRKAYRKNKKSGLGQIAFFIFIVIFSLLGRGRRGGLLTGLMLGSMIGGSSGRSSGGFGGGFSGGGGGGFSGGGASGGW